MRKVLHIVFVLIIVLCAYSCREKGRVIPKDDMAELYVEMLLLDQWLVNNHEAHKIADTSLVYEPILNEYGYSSKDYLASVDYYLRDPEQFSKIFDKVKKVLEKHVNELTVEERRAARLDSIRRAIDAKPFKRAEVYLFAVQPDSVRRDTVSINVDLAGCLVWDIIYHDTIYSGPVYRLKTRDTVSVAVEDSADAQVLKFSPDMLKPVDNVKENEVYEALPEAKMEVQEIPHVASH